MKSRRSTRVVARLLALSAMSWAAAVPISAASLPSTGDLAKQFPARVLAAHNAARARAGMAPLAWDPALGNAAASYAMRLALTNSFQHSDRGSRAGTGENLWMGTHGAYSFEAMVGGWISERRYFSPGVFPAVSRSGNWEDVGHYTQMVWPTTQRVGCALASNARADFLVCRYWPSGNVMGRAIALASGGRTSFGR